MRPPVIALSVLFLTAAAALPARACINDREVTRAEREFKSQYQQTAPAGEPTSEPSRSEGLSVAFMGGGTVLLLGAAVTVLNLRKPSGPA